MVCSLDTRSVGTQSRSPSCVALTSVGQLCTGWSCEYVSPALMASASQPAGLSLVMSSAVGAPGDAGAGPAGVVAVDALLQSGGARAGPGADNARR
jgi:hypothetical protein